MFNLFFAFVVVAHGAVEVAVRKPVLHVRHRQRTHRIADQIRLLAPPPHVRIRPPIRATVPHIEVAVLLEVDALKFCPPGYLVALTVSPGVDATVAEMGALKNIKCFKFTKFEISIAWKYSPQTEKP